MFALNFLSQISIMSIGNTNIKEMIQQIYFIENMNNNRVTWYTVFENNGIFSNGGWADSAPPPHPFEILVRILEKILSRGAEKGTPNQNKFVYKFRQYIVMKSQCVFVTT